MSEIRATTISDAAGTGPITLTGQSAAKAWVNFDGTGTVAIRNSINVGSITDNGTGNYTVNFNNAFDAANYAVTSTGEAGGGSGNKGPYTQSAATTSYVIYCYDGAGSLVDNGFVGSKCDGDLA